MKKTILLAAALLAAAVLSGCAHPNDILDALALAATNATQA